MFAESHTVVQEPLPQQEGVPAISSVRSAPVLQPQFHLLVPVNWYTACKRLLDMLLATVLLEGGQAEQAREQVRSVLERRRDWIPARLIHALARERLGQSEEALQEFRTILRQHPNHEPARAGMARLLEKDADPRERRPSTPRRP